MLRLDVVNKHSTRTSLYLCLECISWSKLREVIVKFCLIINKINQAVAKRATFHFEPKKLSHVRKRIVTLFPQFSPYFMDSLPKLQLSNHFLLLFCSRSSFSSQRVASCLNMLNSFPQFSVFPKRSLEMSGASWKFFLEDDKNTF